MAGWLAGLFVCCATPTIYVRASCILAVFRWSFDLSARLLVVLLLLLLMLLVIAVGLVASRQSDEADHFSR